MARLHLEMLCLIHDSDQPRTLWQIGKVEGLLEGSDVAVRGASLHVHSTLLNRPIQHLYPLEESVATSLNPCASDQASVTNNEDQQD